MKQNQEDNIRLKKLVRYSEELFCSSSNGAEYQKITDRVVDIAEARYGVFVLFDEKVNANFIKALSGPFEDIKKACSILGFDLLGKKWKTDSVLEERIKGNNIVRFPSISDFIRGMLPEKTISLLEKSFDTGEVIVVRICEEDSCMGYFVLILPSGKTFTNEDHLEVYIRQLKLFLERKRTEEELHFHLEYQKIIADITKSFLNISDDEMDTTINEALQKCGNFLDVERAFIFQLSYDRKRMSMTHEWCSKGTEPHLDLARELKVHDLPWFAKNIRNCEYMHIPDIEELPSEAYIEKKEWKQYSLKSVLNIPLTIKGEVAGFIGFNSGKNRYAWTERQISLLKILAGIISSTFEKKAEREKLLKRKEELKEAQRIGKVGSWRFDLNTKKVHASEEAFNIYGILDSDLTIKKVQSLVLPQYRRYLDRALRDLIEHNKPYSVEFSIKRPCDGKVRHIHSVAEYNAFKNTVIGTIQDITERKEAEERIDERETWKNELIKNSMDGIIVLLTDGSVYETNQRFADMLGYSVAEVKKLHIWEWDAKWKREKLLDMLENVDDNGNYIETLHRRRDGTVIDVEICASSATCAGQELIFCICRDISDRKRFEEQLQKRTRTLDMALEATCAGIWDLDLKTGEITLEGLDSWKKITGYTTDDYPTFDLDKWRNMIHPDDIEYISQKLQDVIDGKEKSLIAEYRMLHKTGQWIWIRAHGRIADHGPDGKPLRMYGTHISIHECKKAEERAKNASRTKSEFLANMSHEIRTPLNGIIGFSDLLLRSELTDTQIKYIQTIHTSANSLLDLINDILDISKIEAGKLELYNEKFDLTELCGQIADLLKYRTHQKGLELLLDIDPDIPRYVIGDRLRLRQVLVNLLGNAVKFTESGEVELKVEFTDNIRHPGKIDLTFSVRDTGIGIADEKIAGIFNSFSQADGSITRKYGGSGLGLSICNKLLEKMGSKLELKSQEGKGSTFSFTIALPANSMEKETCAAEGIKNIKKVLIADDNDNNRRILKNMLDAAGLNTITVANSDEAIEVLCSNNDMDMILADLHLSSSGAMEMIRKIRNGELKVPQDIPFMIMHNATDIIPEDEKKNDESIGHIIKPVKKKELMEIMTDLSTDKPIKMEMKKPESGEGFDGEALNADKGKYSVLIAEDNELNMLLTTIMISRLLPDATILEAKDGTHAVRMFRENDPDIVFMDIQMPEVSGYDATAMIREYENENMSNHTAIIALTAGTTKGEKEKCLNSGMDDFLPKPIGMDIVRRTLDKWLFGQGKSPSKPDKEKVSKVTTHFDAEWLMGSAGGDREIYENLIAMALESFVRNLEEITDHLEKNDNESVRSIAHRTKGAALNTGYNVLAEMAAEIERSVDRKPDHIPVIIEEMRKELDLLKEKCMENN